jgi:maltose-binding protein MalE
MMDQQDQWFRQELMPRAEKELGVKINVATFNNFEDIEQMVKMEKDAGKNTIALVKTPLSEVNPMVNLGLILALNDILDAETLEKDLAEYIDSAVDFGTIDGKTYYIPRKLEANTFLYLTSKVEEAVEDWEDLEDEINAMFEAHNGYGLPEGYELEEDPNEWDWYDVAVVAYYWANTEGEDGLTMARLAHRGKDYGGTTSELQTKLYQMNGTADDFFAMNTEPVVDVFEWEAFYVDNGLYNPAMWEQSWSGGGIWNAFSQGQVYAAFMHQIDAFFIHGGSNPSMQGYLEDPDEMATAIMPQGMSLALDNGVPVRVGKHASNFSGWWWGIPVTTPDAELSYKLARFITNYENHKEECSNFGMMPVRNDVYEDLAGAFKEPWMQDVFKTGLAQFDAGVEQPPLSTNIAQIGSIWRKAWYDIVTKKGYSASGEGVDRAYIEEALKPYAKEVQGLK